MIKNVKKNLEEIESMLYFWQATNDREKVSEVFLNEVASMEGLKACYDNEFNAESVRKVLSAITNREVLSNKTQKEGRFWNNNMWMMEDLEYTNAMVKPIKMLNLDDAAEKLNKTNSNSKYEELEVRFSPLHMDEYIISGNKLIINFFRVKPSDFDDSAFVGQVELKAYVEEKLKELISK